jgi:hypothetical protein
MVMTSPPGRACYNARTMSVLHKRWGPVTVLDLLLIATLLIALIGGGWLIVTLGQTSN